MSLPAEKTVTDGGIAHEINVSTTFFSRQPVPLLVHSFCVFLCILLSLMHFGTWNKYHNDVY